MAGSGRMYGNLNKEASSEKAINTLSGLLCFIHNCWLLLTHNEQPRESGTLG